MQKETYQAAKPAEKADSGASEKMEIMAKGPGKKKDVERG